MHLRAVSAPLLSENLPVDRKGETMRAISIGLFITVAATVANAQVQADRFLNAPDGETVVLMTLGQQQLWGVNTPTKQSGDPYGWDLAQSALTSMMNRTTITVERRDYGVIVYGSNGISINLQMIEAGWGRNGLSSRDAEYKAFEDAQKSAIAKGSGLWATRNASGSPRATASASVASVVLDIRAKCAKDWADDFSMRAFCEKQQQGAAMQLQQRQMGQGDRGTIRAKCARDWPDDLSMRNFCEEQQLKALDSLR